MLEIHDLFTISTVFLISYCICSQWSIKGHGFLTLVSLYSVKGFLDMKSGRQQIVGWRNNIHQLNVFITIVPLATALKSVTYLKSGTCLLVNGLYRWVLPSHTYLRVTRSIVNHQLSLSVTILWQWEATVKAKITLFVFTLNLFAHRFTSAGRSSALSILHWIMITVTEIHHDKGTRPLIQEIWLWKYLSNRIRLGISANWFL